jgi:AcrR family transcriptional regulator
MRTENVPLATRHEPRQVRSRRSVDLILDTAARLLDEVGIEGLNTNLLARRANVRVRTVYRYFPNKYAIVAALTRKLAVQWDAWMTEFYARLAEPGSAGGQRS